MSRQILLFVLGLFLLPVSVVRSQESSQTIWIGLNGGALIPGRSIQYFNTAWVGRVRAEIDGTLPLDLFVESQYAHLPPVPDQEHYFPEAELIPFTPSSGILSSYGVGCGYKFRMQPVSLVARLGVEYNVLKSDVFTMRRYGIHSEAGAVMKITRAAAVELAIRYQVINALTEDSGEFTRALMSVTAGIVFDVATF